MIDVSLVDSLYQSHGNPQLSIFEDHHLYCCGYFLPVLFPFRETLWDGNFISRNRLCLLASGPEPSVFASTGMSTGQIGVLEHTLQELAWMELISL